MSRAQQILSSITILALMLLTVGSVSAESPQIKPESIGSAHRIIIKGKKSATVTTKDVILTDLASIESDLITDDEAIIALQKIKISASPKPGEKSSITASEIVEKLRQAGVNLETVGYLLPKVIEITRASRLISVPEVQDAVEASLKSLDREISIKSIAYRESVAVAPGELTLQAFPYGSSAPGEMRFQIRVKDQDGLESRFVVTAKTEEWIQVPVASRPIGRGAVIADSDLQMARVNLDRLPKDAAYKSDNLLGFEVTQSVGAGEVFRRTSLKIPPVITQGGQVVLRYRSGILVATATGTAMEPGIKDQIIKVKNDSSKKIISAKVVEPGLVEVQP